MEYQHRVTVWNYNTEIVTKGCFRTRDEAEAFRDATEGHEKSYSSEMGNWPYSVFTDTFDASAAQQRARDWMARNGGVTGMD